MIEPRCLIAPQLRSTLFPDYFAADRKWFRGGTQHGFMPWLRRRDFDQPARLPETASLIERQIPQVLG
jgi:hypothetical protein